MLNNRNIFLLDGIGAGMSTLSTGFVQPIFFEQLGLPPELLRGLAAFPAVYMFYSLSCFFLAPAIKNWMLGVIIFANSFYCLLSFSLLFWLQGIKPLGVALLIVEVCIILAIVAVEANIYRTSFRTSSSGHP